MNNVFVNTAVKLFLQEKHPTLFQRNPTAFLDSWATWVQTHHPATWAEFLQHIPQAYPAGPLADYLRSHLQPAC